MVITHGMELDEVERFGRLLLNDYPERVRATRTSIEMLVSESKRAWQGPDSDHFQSWWPSKRVALDQAALELQELGRLVLANVEAQRSTSSEAGHPTRCGSDLAWRSGSNDVTPFVVESETSSRESKSGAVARGVDGSVISLRRMSDGTVEVEVILGNGMELSIGDAAQLAQIARGDFFSSHAIQWDVDLSAIREEGRTFSFTDADSARLFFEALKDKQGAAANVIGGSLGLDDLKGVIRDLDGKLEGEVTWSGYEPGYVFSADGGVSVQVGDGGPLGGSAALGGTVGRSVETLASDGSTGELSRLSGRLETNATVQFGPESLEAGAGAEYGREVHLVRAEDGSLLRLEVRESLTTGVHAEGGIRFLGTGTDTRVSETVGITSTRVFDLSRIDAELFAGAYDPSSLYEWSSRHSDLGSQTVTTTAGDSSSHSSSLLFSGEWLSEESTSEVEAVFHRPPGGEFTASSFAAQPGLDHRQVIQDGDGQMYVVHTAGF